MERGNGERRFGELGWRLVWALSASLITGAAAYVTQYVAFLSNHATTAQVDYAKSKSNVDANQARDEAVRLIRADVGSKLDVLLAESKEYRLDIRDLTARVIRLESRGGFGPLNLPATGGSQ